MLTSPDARRAPDEETELRSIVDLLEAYEVKRWPLGKQGVVRLLRSRSSACWS